MQYQLEVAGVDSLLIRFDLPSDHAAVTVASCAAQLRQSFGTAVVDIIPAYASLLIIYDLMQLDDQTLRQRLQQILEHFKPDPQVVSGKPVQIPVCYEAEFAPDLATLATQLKLSEARIIELHCAGEYKVQAVGFAPGFAYLGSLPQALRVPRKATPRTDVPAGAVAIAEHQTAVYPQVSPGGWWLIGRCPLVLFDTQAEPPGLLAVGDRVRFEPISAADFKRLLS